MAQSYHNKYYKLDNQKSIERAYTDGLGELLRALHNLNSKFYTNKISITTDTNGTIIKIKII